MTWGSETLRALYDEIYANTDLFQKNSSLENRFLNAITETETTEKNLHHIGDCMAASACGIASVKSSSKAELKRQVLLMNLIINASKNHPVWNRAGNGPKQTKERAIRALGDLNERLASKAP